MVQGLNKAGDEALDVSVNSWRGASCAAIILEVTPTTAVWTPNFREALGGLFSAAAARSILSSWLEVAGGASQRRQDEDGSIDADFSN